MSDQFSEQIQAGLPPPPPVNEPIAYRPISGFAVAGLAAASLFALLVVVATGVALFQGTPFFYPLWVVILPATALVLSLIARSQIRNSEGTRAGDAIARAGVWISLLTGLGYFVYYYVTGLAVTSQANDFLMTAGPDSGFFAHLLKAADSPVDTNAAFLLSVPPDRRAGVRAEDEAGMRRQYDQSAADGAPPPLSMFRKHLLYRLITTAPPGQVTIEPLGVQRWDYESRSYRVTRTYRITTPEVSIELPIVTLSSEGEAAGDQRKWYLPIENVQRPKDPRAVKLTDLGLGLDILRREARKFLDRWRFDLNTGQSFDLAAVVEGKNWKQVLPSEEPRAYVKGRLEELFADKEPRRLMSLQMPFDEDLGLGDWRITPDKKVQLEFPLKYGLDPAPKHDPYMVEGRIVAETTRPIDPATVRDGPSDLEWKVGRIIFSRIAPAKQKKGPMPGERGSAPL
jgi:hypothetical protein